MNGLNKIILHWTAGSWTPNETDKKHYHFIISGAGNVILGNYKPEDNINCKDGKYAEHCGSGNTGAIGIALAGMLSFDANKKETPFPIRKQQFESAMSLMAKLCKMYKISVESVMTHKEFGDSHPTTTSHGKIDICYLHCYPEILPDKIGDFIRSKVKWYMQNK